MLQQIDSLRKNPERTYVFVSNYPEKNLDRALVQSSNRGTLRPWKSEYSSRFSYL
jgi:hypothetical protein